MVDYWHVNRKFERLIGLSSDQMCCRDYISMDEQKRLAAQDPSSAPIENSGILLGTFVYDFEKGTEEFIPSENYKK